jgi:S1-C subfamily serine protease
MKTLATVALTLALLLVPAKTHAQDWSPLPDLVRQSIVRLEIVAGDSGGVCSGVIINQEKGYVVTNAHCIPEQGGSVAVSNKHAELEKWNLVLDIAVLQVRGIKGKSIAIRVPPAPIGTPIAIVGHAFGAPALKYQFGWVSDPLDEGFIFGPLIDARIFPGDSGGAMVDQRGELVTINRGFVGLRLLPNAFALGVDPETLRDFIKPYLP